MVRKEQERSQNTEENIPEAKNSFLRHSQIQSSGPDRVDSGTEERWRPGLFTYILKKKFVGGQNGYQERKRIGSNNEKEVALTFL